MDYMYLVLTALGESGGSIFDRLNFRKNKKTDFRHILFLGFVGMSLVIWSYIVVIKPTPPEITSHSLILISLVILFSLTANIFDCLSLKLNDLSLREPIVDFYPILAGFFGYLLFPDERNLAYLWAFGSGAIVLYWGIHRIKLRKNQRKGLHYLILAIALYAALPSIYKEALDYVAPEYISGFRVIGILLVVTLFVPLNKMHKITWSNLGYSFLSSVAASVGAIASIYAIKTLGVVETMTFMMLGPAIRYLAGQFILKEKVKRTEVLSSLMLTLIVAVAAFVK